MRDDDEKICRRFFIYMVIMALFCVEEGFFDIKHAGFFGKAGHKMLRTLIDKVPTQMRETQKIGQHVKMFYSEGRVGPVAPGDEITEVGIFEFGGYLIYIK